MDPAARELGSILSNLEQAVRSHCEVMEKCRVEMSSYAEMRERGDSAHVMALRTSQGLTGHVGKFVAMAQEHGEIDKLRRRSTAEIAAFVWNTMLTALAYNCIALEIYTARLVEAGDSLEEAIATVEGMEWLTRPPQNPEPS